MLRDIVGYLFEQIQLSVSYTAQGKWKNMTPQEFLSSGVSHLRRLGAGRGITKVSEGERLRAFQPVG